MKKLRLFFLTMLLSAMSVNLSAQTVGDTFTKTLEDGVSDMTFEVIATDRVAVIGCTTTATEVTVPQTIMNIDKTFNVTNVLNRTFALWSSCITKVNLPEGLLSMNWNSFNGAKIKTLEIPSSLTSIEVLAFQTQANLTEITVRPGNTKYEAIDGILYSTQADHQLVCVPRAKTFDDGVLTIAEGTKTLAVRSVYGNNNITKIVFPSTMTSLIQKKYIDQNIFSIESCPYLAEVEVADGNTNIYVEDNVVFANDENKTLLYFPGARVNAKNSEGKAIYTVPDGVKAIADYACSYARFQILGLNEVETIGKQAFYACNNLSGVSLSQNLSVISEGALQSTGIQNFYMDGELTGESDYFSVQDGVIFSPDKTVLIQFPLGRTGAYEIPAGTTAEIGGYAFANSLLTDITIPESVTKIDQYAFSFSGIKSVVLPEGLESMSNNVFYGALLEEITLPSTLELLPNSAFNGCARLKTVNFAEGLKKIGSTVFYSCI